MNIIDISWPITNDMTAYKNRREVELTRTKKFEVDGVRSSVVTLGSHSGTHVDAPAHFIADGGMIESVPLERLIGKCEVVDMTHVDQWITAADFDGMHLDIDSIVLLKTKNSELSVEGEFEQNFIFLEKSGALLLAEKNVKAVGIDYLGIERRQPDHDTHVALLSNNIPIIEGLRLGHVAPGSYEFYCLPLAVHGLEAAPARAVLILS